MMFLFEGLGEGVNVRNCFFGVWKVLMCANFLSGGVVLGSYGLLF